MGTLRRVSMSSNVIVAVMVGNTGIEKRTGKPVPTGILLLKNLLKFSACDPVRASTSATGKNCSACEKGEGGEGGGG